jgi:hypothetical protein
MKRQRKLIWVLSILAVFLIAGLVPAGDLDQAETKQGGPAGQSHTDSALENYVYPGSEEGGRFSMGNMVSVQYTSQDEFVQVMNHYKKKFPNTNVGSGTSVYFGKQNPDGSDLTVTLTKLDNGTQIILQLNKKP